MRSRLQPIPGLRVSEGEPLKLHTRFGIGGEAGLLAEASSEEAFLAALAVVRERQVPLALIGGGSNLVVSDQGFPGLVLRYLGDRIGADGTRVSVEAGAELQALVDFTIDRGLRGLGTMTGIPGWVGAAVYGNAGAYGHSIAERVSLVRYWDGEKMCSAHREQCCFAYRESIFKKHKSWFIFSAELSMDAADPNELRKAADEIRRVRDAKYPPSMRCAGSIFKNCILADLPAAVVAQVPAQVVREGKIPAAWFLEQVGAKGMRRGDIQVASYHANLIYNDGNGRAEDLCHVIRELKQRVLDRFGFELEEEVQYIGF
ncbi:MAG: UDP-N-acetylmuramate dehydrogenase [Acidobacteriia bacterium]|nr:UDP-N-acetylmuramate dehydrogenase [Terriglobia bacterium]